MLKRANKFSTMKTIGYFYNIKIQYETHTNI